VSKRPNVVSVIDGVLDELLKRQAQMARAALTVPTEKSEFEYGRVVGRFQTYEEVLSFIEHYLNESDPVPERHEEN
jgi:uncharacterized protein YfdQ (DUF2303 family)